jgi:signal recognition particle subunit SRP54
MRKQIDAVDDDELVRTQAIVQSMTPGERRDPKILNGSRRLRIAKGSGRTVTEVNKLVERFSAAQKMMKQMRNGGGFPGMPGGLPSAFPGGAPFGGAMRPVQRKKKAKKKRR